MPRYTVYKRVPADGLCRDCEFYKNETCELEYIKNAGRVVQDCSFCEDDSWKKVKTYSAWRYIPKKYIKSNLQEKHND